MIATDLWAALRATAHRCPQRTALVCGDRSWTFAELAGRAEDFRQAYAQLGVRSGDRVLLWLGNRFEMAAALAGAWGGHAIPALLDCNCRAPQLEHAVGMLSPRVVVRMSDSALPAAGYDLVQIVADEMPRSSGSAGESAGRALPTDPASVVFTSGSTGKAKGVVQTHGNLLRGCRAVSGYLGYADEDVLLCPVPWSYDYGFGQLLSTIVLGMTQVIPTAFTPFGFCEAIERHRPSVFAGLPSLYSYLMSGLSPIRGTDRSSLRLLTNTGGTVPQPVLESLIDAFGHASIVLNYGLTETYRSSYLPPDRTRTARGSIGVPIPGADIAIVREDGTLAAVGEEGEIVHRGDYICLGYWGDAEATARAVRPDPLRRPGSPDPGRALYTGDFGFLGEDGLLYYRGRRDHQLKSMGVRVSPSEVESLLYDSRLVAEVAVFGVPHELLGQAVCAAFVPIGPGGETVAALTRYARRVMTQPMQPRSYLPMDSLPRTPTGKLDYPALRLQAEPAREPGRGTAEFEQGGR